MFNIFSFYAEPIMSGSKRLSAASKHFSEVDKMSTANIIVIAVILTVIIAFLIYIIVTASKAKSKPVTRKMRHGGRNNYR